MNADDHVLLAVNAIEAQGLLASVRSVGRWIKDNRGISCSHDTIAPALRELWERRVSDLLAENSSSNGRMTLGAIEAGLISRYGVAPRPAQLQRHVEALNSRPSVIDHPQAVPVCSGQQSMHGTEADPVSMGHLLGTSDAILRYSMVAADTNSQNAKVLQQIAFELAGLSSMLKRNQAANHPGENEEVTILRSKLDTATKTTSLMARDIAVLTKKLEEQEELLTQSQEEVARLRRRLTGPRN